MGIGRLYDKKGWLALQGIMLYCLAGGMPHYKSVGWLLRCGLVWN